VAGETPYLAGYLTYLAAERRLSRLTCVNYGRDVRLLLELAGSTQLADLQIHHIRRFAAQLHGRGLAGRSIARVLSAWRGFYDYLARDHAVTQNPCLGVRAPKSPKTLPHALSPDETSRLLAASPEGEPLSACDKAMFELFYSSGLRLSELTGLNLGDVQPDEAIVRVTGKGNKTRVVPVGRFALEALQTWLVQRAGLVKPEELALFINRRGGRIGQRTVQMRLKAWAKRQGVTSNVHPHVLRHSFASHVLQSSGDLRAVQEMLGHANISTTQVYTHLDFQHLAKVYDAAHPRARKKP
jgi:integrase/recombinase XerC